MKTSNRLQLTVTAALSLAIAVNPLAAQATGTASGPAHSAAVPVVVVMLSNSLPEPGGRAVIVRRRDATPSDIIVLPASGATAADLAAALNVLAGARRRDNGDLPAAQQRISINSAAFPPAQPPATRQYFDALLARLGRAPVMTVEGVASGRALVIPQNRVTAG